MSGYFERLAVRGRAGWSAPSKAHVAPRVAPPRDVTTAPGSGVAPAGDVPPPPAPEPAPPRVVKPTPALSSRTVEEHPTELLADGAAPAATGTRAAHPEIAPPSDTGGAAPAPAPGPHDVRRERPAMLLTDPGKAGEVGASLAGGDPGRGASPGLVPHARLRGTGAPRATADAAPTPQRADAGPPVPPGAPDLRFDDEPRQAPPTGVRASVRAAPVPALRDEGPATTATGRRPAAAAAPTDLPALTDGRVPGSAPVAPEPPYRDAAERVEVRIGTIEVLADAPPPAAPAPDPLARYAAVRAYDWGAP